jgi:alkylation response protein AidB-like acyl-CoA dehydrogenase
MLEHLLEHRVHSHLVVDVLPGEYGYVREYPVDCWHRDSKIYTIFEGASEIQRLMLARTRECTLVEA